MSLIIIPIQMLNYFHSSITAGAAGKNCQQQKTINGGHNNFFNYPYSGIIIANIQAKNLFDFVYTRITIEKGY